jgi:hypothetical protein
VVLTALALDKYKLNFTINFIHSLQRVVDFCLTGGMLVGNSHSS